jgi:hypothetical protein
MKKPVIKTARQLFEEKALELKTRNAVVKITTTDPEPYDVIVGRIIKMEKKWLTLRRVEKLSDGHFPQTFTHDTFSLDFTVERDIKIMEQERK